MNDIYYENVDISYKTLNIFEMMYNSKKNEIMESIKVSIKEKYNIDIITNGTKSRNTTTVLCTSNVSKNDSDRQRSIE
tara:strand:- start:2653 stop:2886 length:234 start_codon:yes stop_codon:yes gene_type:complete